MPLENASWEDHARKGTSSSHGREDLSALGQSRQIPDGWLDDVLSRSRFDFNNQDNVWATDGLDFDAVAENQMTKDGYLVLNFIDGSKVAIGFDKLETVKSKSSFIHDLALSMLPPNLSTVMTPDAIWALRGKP